MTMEVFSKKKPSFGKNPKVAYILVRMIISYVQSPILETNKLPMLTMGCVFQIKVINLCSSLQDRFLNCCFLSTSAILVKVCVITSVAINPEGYLFLDQKRK